MINPVDHYEKEIGDLKKSRARNSLALALSLLGLLLFISWEGILLKSYIARDTRPPAWDQADHLDIALNYWRALRGGRWDWKTVFTLPPKSGMPPFPPLYHLALTQAYRASNPAGVALWVNFAYFALLCFSVFGCAYFFRPDYTALLAAIAFCASPAIWDLMTTQLMDLPVAALATAALWAFLISEGFSHWNGSLLFGFLFGVGMMHKWSFFPYFIPAYISAVIALKFPQSRWKVLSAALLSLLIFGPWYAYHFPILVPRLFQASSDMAAPLWNGGIVAYLFGALDGLGPFLFALGFAGIFTAQYRRHRNMGWVIMTTVISSYIFWTIVPNRQLRFLLPGLSGLAIAAVSAWPNIVLWLLASFQIFTAANLMTGWISPVSIPLPFHSISLFPQGSPEKDNWHIADILETAESKADPARSINNLTLIANAAYFNGPNFAWTDDYLALKKIHVRGANKRLCEFSEFLVLKMGDLGPPGVIGGLEDARKTILQPDGWFEKAYQLVSQWPLPDNSVALLFQQKRFATPPLRSRKIHFQFYSDTDFNADNLTLNLGNWDKKSASYPLADLRASSVRIRGLLLKNIHLQMKNLSLIPVFSKKEKWDGEIRFLKMRELKVLSVNISSSALAGFLEARAPGLTINSISIDHELKIQAVWRKIPVSAEAAMNLQGTPGTGDSTLALSLLDLHAGPINFPHFILNKWAHIKIPFYPNPETPFDIVPDGLTLAHAALSIP